jgi:hypothetical protein
MLISGAATAAHQNSFHRWRVMTSGGTAAAALSRA